MEFHFQIYFRAHKVKKLIIIDEAEEEVEEEDRSVCLNKAKGHNILNLLQAFTIKG